MKIQILITVLIFLSFFQARAENNYKEIIVSKKYIFALTNNGSLKTFDKNNGNEINNVVQNLSKIILLVNDNLGNAVIADKKNTIKRYNEESNKWEEISKYKKNIYGLVFDNKNFCYAITEKGIEDLKTKKIYYSDKSLNHQIRYKNEWGNPYCYYMDTNNRIWIGFGYGEWGGNIFIFDTSTKEFLVPNLNDFQISLWPIKSFFEDKSSVYLSAGLQHFLISGTIIKFDNFNAIKFLDSKSHWSEPSKTDSSKTMIDGEYIGPATYNKFNNSIYFYSQNGIFKGDVTKDLSKMENWELILKPVLHWKDGQPDAIGSPMNVYKIINLDNDRLIFLSQNDGIGYYDGKTLKMIE